MQVDVDIIAGTGTRVYGVLVLRQQTHYMYIPTTKFNTFYMYFIT